MELQYTPDARYNANVCYMPSEIVSQVQQTCLRFCAHTFHMRIKRVYGFMPRRFTREANAFAVLSLAFAVLSHTFRTRTTLSYLYALKLAWARMRFSRRRVLSHQTLVHCYYGALHNSCFCGVLVACFASSAMREDSVLLNFATHINISIISLQPLLAWLVSATRATLTPQ